MSDGFYADKIYWITGASSGIGQALAISLSKRGAKLILSGRNTDALEETRKALSTEALILAFDTTDYDALPGLVEQALAWQGRIDGLINNAGISQRSLIVDTDMDLSLIHI